MFTTTKPWSNLDVSTSRSSITTVFGSTIPSEPGRKGPQVLGIWWAPDDGHRLMTQDLEKIQGSLFDPTPYLPKKSPVFRWLLSIDVCFFPRIYHLGEDLYHLFMFMLGPCWGWLIFGTIMSTEHLDHCVSSQPWLMTGSQDPPKDRCRHLVNTGLVASGW